MSGFSTTQEIDNPICPCQQGNIFLNRLPLDAPPIQCSVNGKTTGPLPTDLIYRLDNSLDGTTARLAITPDGGDEITLIEDLDAFTQSRPEDVGVIIDQAKLNQKPQPYVPKGRLMEYAIQTTSQSEAEDVLVVEIASSFVPEGEHDVDTIDSDLAYKISNALLNGLELSDRLSGADDLLAWSHENLKIGDMPLLIDFTATGTDGPPVIAEIIATISYNRQFLVDALHRQSRKVKVWTSGAGKLLMSFRYAQPARALFQGLAMGVMANRVVQISAGATQTLRPLSANVARKLPLIGVTIVASIEVTEYFATEPSKRELNALFAALFVELGAVIIGGIIGGIGAALIIGIAGITAPIAIIAVGVAAGIAVGIGITSIVDHLDIEAAVKNALDNFGSGFENMTKSLERFVEAVDEATYDPVEWAMDVDQGIRQRVDGTIQSLINNLTRNR